MTRLPSVFRELSRHQASHRWPRRSSPLSFSLFSLFCLLCFCILVFIPLYSRDHSLFQAGTVSVLRLFLRLPWISCRIGRLARKMHRFIPRQRTQIFEAATERNVPSPALSVIDLEWCTARPRSPVILESPQLIPFPLEFLTAVHARLRRAR